jgi:hypothetical protein
VRVWTWVLHVKESSGVERLPSAAERPYSTCPVALTDMTQMTVALFVVRLVAVTDRIVGAGLIGVGVDVGAGVGVGAVVGVGTGVGASEGWGVWPDDVPTVTERTANASDAEDVAPFALFEAGYAEI